jgi:phosphoribosylanthranilate isomerase
VQLHGKQSLESVLQDMRPAIDCVGVGKLIPMIPESALRDADGGILISHRIKERIFALLIDSQVNGSAGGTGATFDWEVTQGMVQALGLSFPVIVAGGLNALNVARALKIFQPFGVDVASGVEARPGKKDPEKVRAFVKAVREIDVKVS